MIALFKQKSPGNIAALFIFGLLIKLPIFLYPKGALVAANDTAFYKLFADWIAGTGAPYLAPVLAFLLIYIQALSITHLINVYRMTARQSFVPGLAYMLITSLLPEWNLLSAPMVATTFVIWGFSKLFELYNVSAANSKIFNIGLLLGVASFFFFPSVVLALCIILGLMILRPFRLNEIFLMLLGVTTPYYFYAVFLFLADKLDWRHLVPALSIQVPVLKNSIWLVGSVVLLGTPFLVGGYFVQTHLRKMLIQARKNWSITLLYLLLALLAAFVNTTGTFTTWFLTLAPFAAFHASAYLYAQRNWLPNVLFWLTLTFIIAYQYGTPAWQ